ncbi:MAG: hypothetical protein RMJ97_05420 [Raineya sp.]|nr:hypothetical protein [Raineya sp.]MDW8296309.1 hypothetical protein [Raineya sp.]
MNKFLLFVLIVGLTACDSKKEDKSQKGDWSDKDTAKFIENCTEKYKKDEAIKASGTDVGELCKCMAEKAQSYFDSPSAIGKAGENKLLDECFKIR